MPCVLKIKQDSDFYRNIAAEFMSQPANVPLAMIKTHGNWITAMKLIADCSRTLNCNCNNNNDHVFSQIQLYDFLTLATKVIEGEERRVNDNKIVLKILRDIMENYNNYSDYLKSTYPGIIVDVISIIDKGIDTKGSRVNTSGIEKYYQLRKQQATMTEEEQKEEEKTPVTATTAAAAIHKEKILL